MNIQRLSIGLLRGKLQILSEIEHWFTEGQTANSYIKITNSNMFVTRSKCWPVVVSVLRLSSAALRLTYILINPNIGDNVDILHYG